MPLSRVLMSCSCVKIPLHGVPYFPFIVQEKAWVTEEEKEKSKREKKASKVAGSFFSFIRVPSIL